MVTAAPFETDKDTVKSVIEMAQDVSKVVMLQDQLKQMEQEKLEAERFAAVGQTVAGLAHGVKNILMGLEGGMYIINSGLKRSDNELIASGWEMLQNNIEKISTVVKEYLKFASGSEIKVEMANPARIAQDVFHFYRDAAQQSGIDLTAQIEHTIRDAPLDPDGIHMCLVHLVSNAIDACSVSDKKKRRVVLLCKEKDGTILYEVEDNGTGMDYEIRKKVFRSFFSTKASSQGTGLGLLIARRIVHEHGGKISFESTSGKGSRFIIELPRARLPKILTGDSHHRGVRGRQ
jgi:signal transduction histidine kinase